MTTQALERAARALYRADPENYGTEDTMWSSYVEMARAVLMAVQSDMFNEASGRVFNRPAAHAIQAILNDGEGE